MDRESGKTWDYERAETGIPVYPSDNDLPPGYPAPLAVYPPYGMCGSIGFQSAVRPGWSKPRRSNGPARESGMDGHNTSAIGSPY